MSAFQLSDPRGLVHWSPDCKYGKARDSDQESNCESLLVPRPRVEEDHLFHWGLWLLIEVVRTCRLKREIADKKMPWIFSGHQFSDDDIPDQTGKVALITGGTSGIGLHSAMSLYKKNATVILTARSHAKGREAIRRIWLEVPESRGSIRYGLLELKSLRSVREFADWFLSLDLPLHLLICNAGVAAVPYESLGGKIESQFFINFLSHCFLSELLLDVMKASAPSRIVFVTSISHKFITDYPIHWETLARKEYSNVLSACDQYGVSKLAVLCWANHLAKTLAADRILVNAIHPGEFMAIVHDTL
jgi:NAD(P)-dependent dehydrogenase (short-subunit alcohol dehydrogenase family)